MFSMTYDELLQRALGRITANVDKSEGSLIYDAVAPCVTELYEAYLYMNELEKRVYADTAYEEYLDMRCKERGIYRKSATYSVRKGEFNIDVPIGSRWAKEELIYTVTERVDVGSFLLLCNESGTIGNRYNGDLVNMDGIQNVNNAKLTDIVIPGEEQEDDDSLRERYFSSFDRQAFGGNIKDYEEKVGAISGVGQVKVFPVWDGNGTVKIIFLDSDDNVPNSLLVGQVQEKVDPTSNSGEGLGIAPIGHKVTVESPKEVDININTKLTFRGTSWDVIQQTVKDAIESYFNYLRSEWTNDDIVVRIAQIESRLLDIEGIIDVENTTLNGSPDNVRLTGEQVPKLNEVTTQ